jgi:hypothetical protein
MGAVCWFVQRDTGHFVSQNSGMTIIFKFSRLQSPLAIASLATGEAAPITRNKKARCFQRAFYK